MTARLLLLLAMGAAALVPSSFAAPEGEKSVEGCVVQEGSEFFLQPKKGKLMRMNSSGELGAFVGRRVKVRAHEQRSGSSGDVGGTLGASKRELKDTDVAQAPRKKPLDMPESSEPLPNNKSENRKETASAAPPSPPAAAANAPAVPPPHIDRNKV